MTTNTHREDEEYKPDWAHRAEHIEYRPNWVDGIPHVLWELGEVFFPIPNREKGWNYPHHIDEYRYAPDDEILNAYLESNFNYGISCAGNLSVVDIDEKEYIQYLENVLPKTAHQVTGSKTGKHYFYNVPNLRNRITLRVNFHRGHLYSEGYQDVAPKSRHLGEVKADPHGYVVGPGSTHPSGNTYGPIKGDEITVIEEDELRDALNPFIHESSGNLDIVSKIDVSNTNFDDTKYEFYKLTTDDVIPWLEAGKRVPHPVHGSDTGSNFMKQQDEDLCMCWRHDYGTGPGTALNAQHLLAIMATREDCDIVRRRWKDDPELHYDAWTEAVSRGLVSANNVPYTVALGYALKVDMVSSEEEFGGEIFWDAVNAARCTNQLQFLPTDERT